MEPMTDDGHDVENGKTTDDDVFEVQVASGQVCGCRMG